MPKNAKANFTCFFIGKENKATHQVIASISDVMKDLEGRLIIEKNKRDPFSYTVDSSELDDIAKSDVILFGNTDTTENLLYGIGVAHALGKPIIGIREEKTDVRARAFLVGTLFFEYSPTKKGIEDFKSNLKRFFRDYKTNPYKFQSLFPYIKKSIETEYIIDLEKLGPREYENLCFELISQMGFRKVSWGAEMKEFDMIATLPKRDPDGFEYQELWLIITGNNEFPDKVLDMALYDSELLLSRLQRNIDAPNILSRRRSNFRTDTSITLLFVVRDSGLQESVDRRIERAERQSSHRSSATIRIRTWDAQYLTKLIQTYPQIGYKYFSEQSRTKSKYRKSPDELYAENISLVERLLAANAAIEEEKRKRFIAERETAWKDVAFKAAHKLGNPVDATDVFLQSLKKKLDSNDTKYAKEISESMDRSIEEAKAVIGQFKSLTKIEEINARLVDIVSLIKNSCKTAQENGVDVRFELKSDVAKAFVDPERISECFNELVANSLHWFDKQDKKVTISISQVSKKNIPIPLDSQKKYLLVRYIDNGCGVSVENKEKIFSPFFSTYQHGTGLGLSIVKKVIELQGGWIVEKGTPDMGVEFDIFLPAKDPKLN